MIYVFKEGSVVYDNSTLSEEEKQNAVSVGELPIPEEREGKYAQIKADLKNNKVYYEYFDIQDRHIEEPEPEPVRQPSLDDYLLDLDFRLSSIELGL